MVHFYTLLGIPSIKLYQLLCSIDGIIRSFLTHCGQEGNRSRPSRPAAAIGFSPFSFDALNGGNGRSSADQIRAQNHKSPRRFYGSGAAVVNKAGTVGG